jgi:hypothetical protein
MYEPNWSRYTELRKVDYLSGCAQVKWMIGTREHSAELPSQTTAWCFQEMFYELLDEINFAIAIIEREPTHDVAHLLRRRISDTVDFIGRLAASGHIDVEQQLSQLETHYRGMM